MRFDVALIQKRRMQMGLSAHKLAKLAGVSPVTMLRLEREEVDSNPATVKAVADALGLDVADLIIDQPREKTA